MKKLLLVLSVLSAVALSSCNSMGDYEMPPTYGGQVIYQNVSIQHALSSEPTNVAFRLMIWLRDSKPGEETDTYKKLFGNLPVENIAELDGTYTITYPSNYSNDYDYKKVGTIVITTNGNVLENDQDAWTVTVPSDNPLKIVTRQMNSYNDTEYKFSSCYGTITYNGSNSWNIDATTTLDYPKVKEETPQLSWTVSNYVSLTPGADAATAFDKFVKGIVTVDRYSNESGNMELVKQEFTWEVDEPLIYKMSCKQQSITPPFISKGALTMTYDTTDPLNYPVDKQMYPSNSVEVSFESTDGMCGANGLLKYNGYQFSF